MRPDRVSAAKCGSTRYSPTQKSRARPGPGDIVIGYRAVSGTRKRKSRRQPTVCIQNARIKGNVQTLSSVGKFRHTAVAGFNHNRIYFVVFKTVGVVTTGVRCHYVVEKYFQINQTDVRA